MRPPTFSSARKDTPTTPYTPPVKKNKMELKSNLDKKNISYEFTVTFEATSLASFLGYFQSIQMSIQLFKEINVKIIRLVSGAGF